MMKARTRLNAMKKNMTSQRNSRRERPQKNNYQQTLVIIKPDRIRKDIMGRIIERFEDKGLCILGLKMVAASDELAGKQYRGDTQWRIDVGAKP